MDVGVFLHVGLLVETLAAVLARVGPRVRVDQQVRRQRRRAFERFAALSTLEDLLGAVQRPGQPSRSDQGCPSTKRGPARAKAAFPYLYGPTSVGCGCKSWLGEITIVFFIAWFNFMLEGGGGQEGLITGLPVLRLIVFDVEMFVSWLCSSRLASKKKKGNASRLPVLAEADLVAERFVADLAGEGPFAVVRAARVHLETVRRREHLLALDAGEGVAAASVAAAAADADAADDVAACAACAATTAAAAAAAAARRRLRPVEALDAADTAADRPLIRLVVVMLLLLLLLLVMVVVVVVASGRGAEGRRRRGQRRVERERQRRHRHGLRRAERVQAVAE